MVLLDICVADKPSLMLIGQWMPYLLQQNRNRKYSEAVEVHYVFFTHLLLLWMLLLGGSGNFLYLS